MNKKKLLLLASTALLSATSQAQTLCVYDLLGAVGDITGMAKDYAIAAKSFGAQLSVKTYTEEKVVTSDLIAGQCDAIMVTGFRAREFNPISTSLDDLGASTIVRDGKVDMPASYEVVRKAISTFSSPAAAKLMVKGKYEVGGIIPFGTAYPVVNDRNINTVEALAGKKIAAFDYDKAQAIMIQKIGAQPVSADITNFAGKFNNGSVDFIAAPAMAYKPLELFRGIGTKGAIQRFPILILTYQLVLDQTKFPAGFGEKSRQYWLTQYDRAMALIKKAEKEIPAGTWGDLKPENMIKYTIMLRDARIDIANKGVYDKQGLKILKRVRCSVNPSDSECATNSENWN